MNNQIKIIKKLYLSINIQKYKVKFEREKK